MPSRKRTTANGPHYGGDGPVTTSKRYLTPTKALAAIREMATIHGSQGRALHVATEILIRQKRPIKLQLQRTAKDGEVVRISLKLLPRTIELIDKLTPIYGSQGRVITACAEVLKKEPA